LRRARTDPDPRERRRACELAARHPGVDLGSALADVDAPVVEMAAWAAGEQGRAAYVLRLAALASTTSGHRDPLCREAAVAALGAIGDPAGLPAVVAALEDKPAVRRRAAAALAAFDGPAAESALRRCLADRDWQVRQVAEDLLAVE
jgi:HEAT repeat protein